jgi:adenylate kinase
MVKGGNIIDFHTCDFFPERWFHLVVVLRTDNSILYPRLEARGYAANKIEENITAEIMEVFLSNAKASYDQDIVVALPSNELSDVYSNMTKITTWITNFKTNNPHLTGQQTEQKANH